MQRVGTMGCLASCVPTLFGFTEINHVDENLPRGPEGGSKQTSGARGDHGLGGGGICGARSADLQRAPHIPPHSKLLRGEGRKIPVIKDIQKTTHSTSCGGMQRVGGGLHSELRSHTICIPAH